jgi:hypothetical protein
VTVTVTVTGRVAVSLCRCAAVPLCRRFRALIRDSGCLVKPLRGAAKVWRRCAAAGTVISGDTTLGLIGGSKQIFDYCHWQRADELAFHSIPRAVLTSCRA